MSSAALSSTARPAAVRIRTPWSEFWRKFRRQKLAVASGIFLLLLVLVALLAPWIAPYDPAAPDYDHVLEGPSALHWAGTDDYGRDILSRIIHGAAISLTVGFFAVTIGGVVGVVLGLLSGFFGGWMYRVVMPLCDVLLAFPGVLLAIGIVAILGPDVENVIWEVVIFSIPVFARLVRGSALALKRAIYVDAARAIGVRNVVLMARHILPG